MADIGRRGKGVSKRGKKGGSSRPGLQESLEELTRLADDLVDSLSDEEAADQAPAEQAAAAEEIFLDLDNDTEETAEVVIEEAADKSEIAESTSMLDTHEAPEEFEIVDPSEQPLAAVTRESEVPAEDDGAALQETLEELDIIGQQEPPSVQRFEVEFAGDKGQDIDAHLDTLFGSETIEQPSEPPTEVAAEPVEHSFEELNDPETEAAPVEEVAVAPESRDVPEQGDAPEPPQSIFDEIEDPPRPSADRTDFQVAIEGSEPAVAASIPEPAVAATGVPHEASRSRRWLAVAGVVVVVATVGAWLFFSRTSGDNAPTAPSPSSQRAALDLSRPVAPVEAQAPATVVTEHAVPVETPVRTPPTSEPVPPVESRTTSPERSEPAVPVETRAPAPVKPKPAAPVQKPTPPPVKVAAPVEKPTPPPVKVAAPVEKPTPPPVKVAAPVEKPTPPPVKVAAPVEEPTPPPVKVAALIEKPTPPPVENKPVAPVETAMRVEPPVVVTRTEPVLTKRSRGLEGTVVLNVLVNEHGQVVRVLIDQGIPGSALEAAAIDAVLRWRYRPGTENGSPARAWVTETFVFER